MIALRIPICPCLVFTISVGHISLKMNFDDFHGQMPDKNGHLEYR